MGGNVQSRTGIIGGSGLYGIEGLEVIDELVIDTPYGAPSDVLTLARMGDHEVVFLPRHGKGQRFPPHQINYRANIYAMKLAGVRQIVSVSAVGSLREHIAPGDFVLVDQFVDRTHSRPSTFFDGPIIAHASMADPVCARLTERLAAAIEAQGITLHRGGTYLVMQGPQFSSRAESELYRAWGMDVIGMTNMPEAKLAREAEMCYATVAMSTDYDCWHQEEEDVSIPAVLEIMRNNVSRATAMLRDFLTEGPGESCPGGCNHVLDHAIFAELKNRSDEDLRPIYALVERLL